MKVIVTSDLHGTLPKIEESFDLLLLPGDLCPVWNHNRTYQWEWLTHEFTDWIKNLPFKSAFSRVVVCAGNHDLCLESISKKKIFEWEKNTDNRLKYLENEAYNFDNLEGDKYNVYTIYATPICKRFGSWAFMRDDLDKYYQGIPKNLDILISHDSPDINSLGMITEGPYKGENAGNAVLAKHIKEAKPKYFFSGHIHSGNHNFEKVDGIWMANVSIMNENYVPINNPLVFEYMK